MKVHTRDEILRKRIQEVDERTFSPEERAGLVLDFLLDKFGIKSDSEIDERLYWDLTCFSLEWLNLFTVVHSAKDGESSMEEIMKLLTQFLYSFHYSMPAGDLVHTDKKSHQKFYTNRMSQKEKGGS